MKKLFASSGSIVTVALFFPLLQLPALLALPKVQESNIPAQASVMAGTVNKAIKTPLIDVFFGEEAGQETAKGILLTQADFVSSRPAYQASLAVVQKNATAIINAARYHGVPVDVALGVALLENGGSEHEVSPAGAMGIFQLMPGTARHLGLTVNKKTDERSDTSKNIEAGVTYLANNFARFGDWGLATWAYHAGEGNVTRAIKIYAKAHDGVNLAGLSNPDEIRSYISSHKLTVYKLLSDSNVQEFTKKLNDDSSRYAYKVAASAALFNESLS